MQTPSGCCTLAAFRAPHGYCCVGLLTGRSETSIRARKQAYELVSKRLVSFSTSNGGYSDSTTSGTRICTMCLTRHPAYIGVQARVRALECGRVFHVYLNLFGIRRCAGGVRVAGLGARRSPRSARRSSRSALPSWTSAPSRCCALRGRDTLAQGVAVVNLTQSA